MSTMSTATTSVARDCIPSNVVYLSNVICIFTLTRDDGTPFNASSIQEEDITKICIWLWHRHPKGVLQYFTIELVMLFHTVDELQVMAHGVMKASMLHKEAIRVRTSLPSATHVRAHMVVVNRKPCGAQPLTSKGEEEPQWTTSDLHPGGRTPHQLQANLGDLADEELWQLMEDLYREVALQELNATHRDPPPTPRENPVQNGDPDVDDWKVTFPRGGAGVLPEQPLWPPTLHNQMEGGNPEDNLLALQHPFNPMKMWDIS